MATPQDRPRVREITISQLSDSRDPHSVKQFHIKTYLVTPNELRFNPGYIAHAFLDIGGENTELGILEAVNDALVRIGDHEYRWMTWKGHIDAQERTARIRRYELGIESYADGLVLTDEERERLG